MARHALKPITLNLTHVFRKLRIAVLLLILLVVSLDTWLSRVYSTDWNGALQVALYPVNVDGSDHAAHYIAELQANDFAPLTDFFEQQAEHYGLNIEQPFRFTLAAPLTQAPPLLPAHPGRLDIALWSLKMRWFAWRAPRPPGPTATIRMFLLYHDAEHTTQVPDSLGLQKGLLGIAHLFAARNMTGGNLIVIGHEILHTLGATDKYDLSNDQPLFPDGLADPQQAPPYPQHRAELMAGRIALSPTQAEQPESLRQVIIGPLTAREIGWVKP